MTSTPDIDVQDKPAIWNPNAAANWSLLFSSAFGAYIQARNAEILGLKNEAKVQWKWFYVSLAWIVTTPFTVFGPGIATMLLNMVGLILLLVWYFTIGRKQAQFVKRTFGTSYSKLAWSKPLLVAFACLTCFEFVAYGLSFIALHIHFTAQLYHSR